MNRLCLVTNATARSICWYVLIYLKESNLSSKRIYEIKSKLNFSDLDSATFSLDDLVKSFTDKNIYFLMLYSHLKEDNRYIDLLINLEKQNKILEYFPGLADIHKIYDDFYNRKVFHTSIFCKWMKNNYVSKNKTHLNTGVFANNILHNKASYYNIDENYLTELKLRECNVCKEMLLNSIGNPLRGLDIIQLINQSREIISVTFDILNDSLIYDLLVVKSKQIKVEIYLRETEWKKADINLLLKQNFIIRLVHNNFSFFNTESMLLLDNELYFHSHSYYYIPNRDNIDTSAFHYLKFNTIAISSDKEENSKYAYYVPVKQIHSSNNEIYGEQSIVELESYGLTSYLPLNCHFDQVPQSIFGFWISKMKVESSFKNDEDLNHSYFEFECIDPKVMEFM